MSKLYFFRHAQASYGAANYDKLSPKGEKQAAILGEYLIKKGKQFDKIFVGPLRRQIHTYEIVAAVYHKNKVTIPEPIFIEGLKEHSGPAAVQAAMPTLIKTNPILKKWHIEVEQNPALKKKNSLLSFQYFMDEWVLGNIKVKGIEPWHIFRQETKKGLTTILENTGKGETIGAFTSGGTISAITAEAINLKDEQQISTMNFSVRNTSFSSFFFSKNNFNLLSFNEIPHLQDDMITFV